MLHKVVDKVFEHLKEQTDAFQLESISAADYIMADCDLAIFHSALSKQEVIDFVKMFTYYMQNNFCYTYNTEYVDSFNTLTHSIKKAAQSMEQPSLAFLAESDDILFRKGFLFYA